MQPHQVTLWVYADSEQDVKNLQNELDKFIMDKYNNGIYVRAAAVSDVLKRYGNSGIVNAFLK